MANGLLGGYTSFLDEIDDWCGTKPPRKFPPRPKAMRDLMLAVVLDGIAERVGDTKLQPQIKSLAIALHDAAARSMNG